MELTTFHNFNRNTTRVRTLGKANAIIVSRQFPHEICLSDAYTGGISTDIHLPPIFHNFKILRCAIPLFNVTDSQLGSILEVCSHSFIIFQVNLVIVMIFKQSVQS